jgi:hypothetical protein
LSFTCNAGYRAERCPSNGPWARAKPRTSSADEAPIRECIAAVKRSLRPDRRGARSSYRGAKESSRERDPGQGGHAHLLDAGWNRCDRDDGDGGEGEMALSSAPAATRGRRAHRADRAQQRATDLTGGESAPAAGRVPARSAESAGRDGDLADSGQQCRLEHIGPADIGRGHRGDGNTTTRRIGSRRRRTRGRSSCATGAVCDAASAGRCP